MLQMILGLVLKTLLAELFKGIFGWLEKKQRDRTNQELGGAVATSNIVLENSKIVTELRNAEARNSNLPRDELLRRMRELGHGNQGANASS